MQMINFFKCLLLTDLKSDCEVLAMIVWSWD